MKLRNTGTMIVRGTTDLRNGIVVIIEIIANTPATIIAIRVREQNTTIGNTIADTNGTDMATTGISMVTESTIAIIAAIMAIRRSIITGNITARIIAIGTTKAMDTITMASSWACRSGS